MDDFTIRMAVVLTFIAVLAAFRKKIVSWLRRDKITMPNRVELFGLKVLEGLTLLCGLIAILGLVRKELEMVIVSSFITLIFGVLAYFSRRKFKKFYSETNEHFLLKNDYREYKVSYKDIINWKKSSKKIGILDQTQAEQKYIYVTFKYFKPEILLRKLAEMIFTKQFAKSETNDPYREQEFIKHLKKNGYQYIIDEYSTHHHT